MRVLVAWGSNVLALLVVDGFFDGVEIRRWGPLVLGAAVLGLANACLKPLLAVLTLPLLVATLGVGYLAISVLMLAVAEWVAPDFSIDGFWTYVGATVVVWAVNAVTGVVLGTKSAGSKRPTRS